MSSIDNNLVVYKDKAVLYVPGNRGVTKFKKYVAKICGPDKQYHLSRKFIRYTARGADHQHLCYVYPALPDGVYESGVTYIGTDGVAVGGRRMFHVVLHGEAVETVFARYKLDRVLHIVRRISEGTIEMQEVCRLLWVA